LYILIIIIIIIIIDITLCPLLLFIKSIHVILIAEFLHCKLQYVSSWPWIISNYTL